MFIGYKFRGPQISPIVIQLAHLADVLQPGGRKKLMLSWDLVAFNAI
jgi:hypothetical protein